MMRQRRLVSVLGGRGSAVMRGWLALSGLLWLAAAGLVQRGLSIEYRDFTDSYRYLCVSCGLGHITQRGRLACELFGLDIYREGQLEYLFLPVRIHRICVPFTQWWEPEVSCGHCDAELTTIPLRSSSAANVPPRAVRWLYCSLLMAAAALLSWVCVCVAAPRKPARRWWLANAACAGAAALCFAAAPGPLLGGTLSRHLRRAEAAAQAVKDRKRISARRIERLLYADVPASERDMMLLYRRQDLALALSRSDRPSDNQAAARYLYGDAAVPDAVTPELLNALYKRFADGAFGSTGCTVCFVGPPEDPASPEEEAGIVAVGTNRLGEVAVGWCQGSCFTQFVRKRIGEADVMLPYYHVMYGNNRGLVKASRERVRRFAEGPGAGQPRLER